ncbi:type 1 fimbrial major subunit FimA [Morganella psychrotolerans]|uniref:Type-1 fimbrial protein subunit A n=1 Tax=Morganella psychrotolerans TaxID=368603 RepID=A0A1B8HE66_9GAMM|nr:type 1 fimbrial major subunit FimA [Morganella psychrotolerans]OBU07355.1 type-1 fimbrial protein subunit A [Morganella psychrotolerans]
MKLNIIGASVVSALLFSAAASADPVIVNGGSVHFNGELVNAACAVSTDTSNQTVELGQYRTVKLKAAGDMTTPVPFKIKLVDCDPTVSATAAIAFSGQSLTGDATLLAVNSGTNAPAAQNVGIQISDIASKVLPPSGAEFSTAKTLLEGTNTLDFTARYVAKGATTPGQANADATFVVKYE